MRRVLVTGASGFIGKNLTMALAPRSDLAVTAWDVDSPATLAQAAADADFVFHLAGVNRPEDPADHERVNLGMTEQLIAVLEPRRLPLALSSSTQAALDNAYGVSKRRAEEAVVAYGRRSGAPVWMPRLPGVFGKWCRPNYNSVVATWCHNLARGLPIEVSDPGRTLELVHVDAVVRMFTSLLDDPPPPGAVDVQPVFHTTLGELRTTLESFRDQRRTLQVPDVGDPFVAALLSTYQSYVEPDAAAYDLQVRADDRGILAEFLKSPRFGQIFISRTKPGITRGHHYHHSKIEKFLVVEGRAVIRFRHIVTGRLVEFAVDGAAPRVVDILPGYSHSIENVGDGELVTLFWAGEIFDPARPDTYAWKVTSA